MVQQRAQWYLQRREKLADRRDGADKHFVARLTTTPAGVSAPATIFVARLTTAPDGVSALAAIFVACLTTTPDGVSDPATIWKVFARATTRRRERPGQDLCRPLDHPRRRERPGQHLRRPLDHRAAARHRSREDANTFSFWSLRPMGSAPQLRSSWLALTSAPQSSLFLPRSSWLA